MIYQLGERIRKWVKVTQCLQKDESRLRDICLIFISCCVKLQLIVCLSSCMTTRFLFVLLKNKSCKIMTETKSPGSIEIKHRLLSQCVARDSPFTFRSIRARHRARVMMRDTKRVTCISCKTSPHLSTPTQFS